MNWVLRIFFLRITGFYEYFQ